MIRDLKSPIRIAIPDRPPGTLLERYRDLTVARVRNRCSLLLARRANRPGDEAGNALAAEGELRAITGALPDHPMARMFAAAGIGELGIEVIGLLSAPYLDVATRSMFAQLQSDLHTGIDRETVRDLTSSKISDAALTAWIGLGGLFEQLGFVEVQRQASGRELVTVTARLLALFEGDLVSDPRLTTILQWRECAASDAEGVTEPAECARVAELMTDVVRSCVPPLAMFVGPSGVGRTRLAQAMASGLGLRWIAILEAPLLSRDIGEIATTFRQVERDVRFLNGLLVIRAFDAIDSSRQQVLASLLVRTTTPIVLITETDDVGALERLVALRHVVRRPGAQLRRAAWVAELGAHGATRDEAMLDRIAMNYPLDRSAIARAVDLAHTRDRALGEEALELAATSQVRSHLERYAKRMLPRTRLSDLVVADETREQIDELAQAVRVRPELNRFLGEARSIGPAGIAALFNGPPGTGKTMTAGALANELGLPMYRIDVSSIVDRYVGETEKNLSRIFEEAESERGLLLFDEADSLFTKRVEVSDSNDRHANMQVNMLLNLIDEYSGFVILTTNLKASIDTAFLRRMSFKVTFDLPDAPERAALWKMHIPSEIPVASGVDLGDLAERFRASGGEIRNAVYRAILMAPPGTALTSDRLLRAMSLELESSGNVVRRSPS